MMENVEIEKNKKRMIKPKKRFGKYEIFNHNSQIPYSLLNPKLVCSYNSFTLKLKLDLCFSLREQCSFCESSTLFNTEINPYPGIPKLDHYVSTLSHEYFSEIIENFIEKQNETMKSQLVDLRSNFSLLPGPVDLLINRINKEIGNFVECIRKRTQNELRGFRLIKSLKKIKRSGIRNIVSEVDDLYNKINLAKRVSFISLSDVFGEPNCLKIFKTVRMCCVLRYLKDKINIPIYQIISNNQKTDLRECSDYYKISGDFSKLDEMIRKQNEEVCYGINEP
uniref:Uncharacterized protein n=1 Tax=Theileria annulata TaxID=5874 RepID=A0A3B0MM19_THEAN